MRLKILYRKENRELAEAIERYTDGFLHISGMENAADTLSAAKAPKKNGKIAAFVDERVKQVNIQNGN